MNKVALINGKTFDISTNTQHILNIMMGKEKIIGLGYIPDDEGVQVIDITNCLVIPNILISQPKSIVSINSHTLHSPSELDKIFASKPTIIGTDTTGSELLYTLQLSSQHNCSLHITLKNSEPDLDIIQEAKQQNAAVTVALPYSVLIEEISVRNSLSALLKAKIIDCISCLETEKENCLNYCFNDLLTFLTLSEIVTLLAQNPCLIFNQKQSPLGLLSSPSFYVIEPKKTPCIRLEVVNGKII